MMADALTGYLLFYAVGQAFYALVYDRLVEKAIFVLSVAALCTRRPVFAVIAHTAFVLRWCWMSPFMFNSDIWATIMDVGVIVATAAFAGMRGLIVPMTSATERDALCREIMAILRNDLMWFYIGAGVWKMNWGRQAAQAAAADMKAAAAAAATAASGSAVQAGRDTRTAAA